MLTYNSITIILRSNFQTLTICLWSNNKISKLDKFKKCQAELNKWKRHPARFLESLNLMLKKQTQLKEDQNHKKNFLNLQTTALNKWFLLDQFEFIQIHNTDRWQQKKKLNWKSTLVSWLSSRKKALYLSYKNAFLKMVPIPFLNLSLISLQLSAFGNLKLMLLSKFPLTRKKIKEKLQIKSDEKKKDKERNKKPKWKMKLRWQLRSCQWHKIYSMLKVDLLKHSLLKVRTSSNKL